MRWWIRLIIKIGFLLLFVKLFVNWSYRPPDRSQRKKRNLKKKLQNEKNKEKQQKEKDQNGRKRNLFRRSKRAKRRRSAVLLFEQSLVWTGTSDASTSVSKAIDVKTCTRQLYFRLGNRFAIYSRHIRTTTGLVCKSLSFPSIDTVGALLYNYMYDVSLCELCVRWPSSFLFFLYSPISFSAPCYLQKISYRSDWSPKWTRMPMKIDSSSFYWKMSSSSLSSLPYSFFSLFLSANKILYGTWRPNGLSTQSDGVTLRDKSPPPFF